VRLRNVGKAYRRRGRLRGGPVAVPALQDVDLDIEAGASLALVGESGSGKTTLGRCLALLERPTSGEHWFQGVECSRLPESRLRPLRPLAQLIFQDPGAALNPRMSAEDVVAEPLVVRGRDGPDERRRRAEALMEQVGLPAGSSQRRALEFSGGQRQRLAIARALAAEPRLLVLDEALSALDPSVQAQIVGLLRNLRRQRGLSYVYISHDLALVAALCGHVAVLQEGRIVERGDVSRVLTSPQHAHTRSLVAGALWTGPRGAPA
jgi:ABC-type glutathione transport system ATPase component